MKKYFAFALAIASVTVPTILLANTLIDTEEDQIDQLLGSIEEERLDGLLNESMVAPAGIVISTREGTRHFEMVGDARTALEDATGIQSADRVQLRQRQVTLNKDRATAVLNIEVSGDYVAIRLDLSRQDDCWVVERIRVMA